MSSLNAAVMRDARRSKEVTPAQLAVHVISSLQCGRRMAYFSQPGCAVQSCMTSGRVTNDARTVGGTLYNKQFKMRPTGGAFRCSRMCDQNLVTVNSEQSHE